MFPGRLRLPERLEPAAGTADQAPGAPQPALAVCCEHGYGVLKRGLAPGCLRALTASVVGRPVQPPGSGRPRGAAADFRLWSESLARVYIPLRLGLARFGAGPGVEDRMEEGEPAPGLAARFEGSLRPPQREAAEAFLSAAARPDRRGGIISMGCGGGKTVVALYCAHAIGRRTLVVVHKEFLMHQWRERIAQYLPRASVGVIQGARLEHEGRDVVLCMLQTLAMRRDIPADALRGYGLAVVDECHHASAQVFSRALRRTEFPRTLGLSATVERRDGLAYVFQWLLGGVVHRCASGAPDLSPVARIAAFEPPPGASAEYGVERLCFDRLNVARMVTDLCGFRPRTRAVAGLVRDTARARAGCKTLVLSERRTHLVDLREALAEIEPALSLSFYVGGMSKESLKESEAADVILGTYAMASEGMDIPALDTLVLATPKSDIQQAVGRVMRAATAHPPLVVDVVDSFSLFAAQARKREAFYRRRSFLTERRPLPAT